MVDRLNYSFRSKISELITCANRCEEYILQINCIINVYNKFAQKTHEDVKNQDLTLEVEFLVINGQIFEKIDGLARRGCGVPAEVMGGQGLRLGDEVGEMKGKLRE